MGAKRSAFTMIELLFVIVILGIVGGFALEAIRNYYEGIYRTGEYTKRVAAADHVLEQLSKYFENAVSTSIVNLDKDNSSGCYGVPGIDDMTADYTVAFVAVDTDSFRGQWNGTRYQPGWSEDVMLNDNNLTALDVNYDYADAIAALLGSSLASSAVYDADSADVAVCDRFRWHGAATAGYHIINDATSTMLELDPANIAGNGKQKYLLRSAYAFRVDDNGSFWMYSNFRPWAGDNYKDTGVKKSLLAQNVAHFYADYNATDFQSNPGLTDRGLVWRLKVCMRGLDANLSDSSHEGNMICRERRVHVRY